MKTVTPKKLKRNVNDKRFANRTVSKQQRLKLKGGNDDDAGSSIIIEDVIDD